MNEQDHLALLRDSRLAAHAASALPAWLWSEDATQILWANAIGAAIFGAPGPLALSGRRFDHDHPAACQVARLARSLPAAGAARLERLRGFGAGVGRTLICAVSRMTLPGHGQSLLVVAAEPVGPSLSLGERVRRLFAGHGTSMAVFSAGGELLHAAGNAQPRLGEATTLTALGAEAVAAAAISEGSGIGTIASGAIEIERIGDGDAALLLATFPEDEARPGGRAGASTAADADNSGATASGPRATPAELGKRQSPDADIEFGLPAASERRHPLRFVWQVDADGGFTLAASEFADLVGARTMALMGRPWRDIASVLGLDPEGHVERALAAHDTFSGIIVAWPVEATSERLPVELAGLPVFDRDRAFRGYRGFGVCRDVARLNAISATRAAALARRAQTADMSGAGRSAEDDNGAGAGAAKVAPAPARPGEQRPSLTVVPAVKNVLPFRPSGPAAAERRPTLTAVEHSAFQEIAKALGARLDAVAPDDTDAQPAEPEATRLAADADRPDPGEREAPSISPPQPDAPRRPAERPRRRILGVPSAYAAGAGAPAKGSVERAILDRVPAAVLVYRGDAILYCNRALLDWTGHEDIAAVAEAGGIERLFAEPGLTALAGPAESRGPLALLTRRGETVAVEARHYAIPWPDEPALLLVLTNEQRLAAATSALRTAEERKHAAEQALRSAEERLRKLERELRAARTACRELEAVLDTATDGVVLVDPAGRILASNYSAEALFGYDAQAFTRLAFLDLFAAESQAAAQDDLDARARHGVAGLPRDGREVIGRTRQGGVLPLFITIGRVADSDDKFCVVLRDITQWKRAEAELTDAKRQAEKASSAKSEFLAKVSHEIRTPLNAIIGFSEVMMEERFGPIENERYRQYLRDIHASGGHLISLINDLLDLSKIEAGKLDLNFTSVSVNDLVQQCVALMQPQANRDRIIIRTSLSPALPPVVADERSVRQIVLNLLSNSIKFTGAGGQVIVSTALTDHGEAVLRVRDTGVGMTEKELETALEPFRQVATSGRAGSGGTGLGLPLTKALAEANRATFTIKSAVNAGTLVEITFPATRAIGQ